MGWKWVKTTLHCRMLIRDPLSDNHARNHAEHDLLHMVMQADKCDPVCEVFDAQVITGEVTPMTLHDVYTRIDEDLSKVPDEELYRCKPFELIAEVVRLRREANNA